MPIVSCPKCEIQFDNYSKWGLKKFCSRKCSNSHVQTEAQNLSRSVKMKNTDPWNKGKKIKTHVNICPTCNVKFIAQYKNKKFCSDDCVRTGGYREGSGRAKSGYYKGIYSGSTYELAWMIYMLDHNLDFKRFENSLVCKETNRRYFPDFIVGNTIIEIKGYESEESVSSKTNIAKSYGYEVEVIRREGLDAEFNWVKENYEYKNIYELYDGYKPKYDLVCVCCNKNFTRDSKPKVDNVCCSRSCSGKLNGSLNWVSNLDLQVYKKIKKEDIESYVNDGWIIGRIMKF